MPQTLEAIDHARAAKVPIIIALNKIDKPDANPDRVKTELSEHGVIVEDYGGDTPLVQVSAKQRLGIDELIEMILLVADLQELKANPKRAAVGTVVEAELDKGRGRSRPPPPDRHAPRWRHGRRRRHVGPRPGPGERQGRARHEGRPIVGRRPARAGRGARGRRRPARGA
jgi:predicted GTPase